MAMKRLYSTSTPHQQLMRYQNTTLPFLPTMPLLPPMPHPDVEDARQSLPLLLIYMPLLPVQARRRVYDA